MNNLVRNILVLLDRGLPNAPNDTGKPWSQAMLAQKVGMTQTTLNRILNPDRDKGIKDPTDSALFPLAKAAGVTIEVLKRGDILNPDAALPITVRAYDVEAVEADEGFDPDKEVWVESVEIDVSAGSGRVVPEFVPTRTRQRYTLKWFRDMGSKPGRVKIAGVDGSSMEPTLYSKDRIAFDLDKKRIISGRVYVVCIAYEVRVKRLFRQPDGSVRIVSDNPDKIKYPDEFVTDDTGGFLVIGQVIERKGSGGL